MLHPPCPLLPRPVFPSLLRPSPLRHGHPALPRHWPRLPCPPNPWVSRLMPRPNHRFPPPFRLHRSQWLSRPSPHRDHRLLVRHPRPPCHQSLPCHPHPWALLLRSPPHHPASRWPHLQQYPHLPSRSHRFSRHPSHLGHRFPAQFPCRPNPPHPRSLASRCHPPRPQPPPCRGLPWPHLPQSNPPLPPS